jgi:cytochrome c oxidase subunit 1
MIALSVLFFFVNIVISYRAHKRNPVDPGPDPWDARSLEWSIPSPTPEHNFDVTPVIEELDDFWHRKYGHSEDGRLVRIATAEEVAQKGDATGVHLPSPSYWPIVLSAAFPFIGYGVIYNLAFAIPGAILLVAGIWGWVIEPSTAPEAEHPHGGHDHHEPDGDGDAEAAAEIEAGSVAELEEGSHV